MLEEGLSRFNVVRKHQVKIKVAVINSYGKVLEIQETIAKEFKSVEAMRKVVKSNKIFRKRNEVFIKLLLNQLQHIWM